MKAAAEAGWLSTKDLAAKIGRASRLGERSRGVLDAGATSCNLLLAALADGVEAHLVYAPYGESPRPAADTPRQPAAQRGLDV
jgi:dihydroxyacetone kinase